MREFNRSMPKRAFQLSLLFTTMIFLCPAADLSNYRGFQFGANLESVVKQANIRQDEVKTLHSRPELIQEFEWRPQPLGPTFNTESVKNVVFSFLNNKLFRIVVTYDRYETAGLTAADFVGALSQIYGVSTLPEISANMQPGRYSDPGQLLAMWQDSRFRFELIRFAYGPEVKLIGVLKENDAMAQAAIVKAVDLDRNEAPQREADRIANSEEAARVKDEKARIENRPKFRP